MRANLLTSSPSSLQKKDSATGDSHHPALSQVVHVVPILYIL